VSSVGAAIILISDKDVFSFAGIVVLFGYANFLIENHNMLIKKRGYR
jgi:hypothetical protein